MGQFGEKMTFTAGINVTGGTVSVPAGTITNAQASAASPFDTDKTVHQHLVCYAQGSATTAADATQVIHVARNSGTIVNMVVGAVVAHIGDSTADFDLLKNGVSILTGAAQTDSGDAAYAKVAASIDTAAYVVGDVFEIDVDATVGTGTLALGPFAQITFDESYDS